MHFTLIVKAFRQDELHHFLFVVHDLEAIDGRRVSRHVFVLVESAAIVFVHRADAIHVDPEVKLYVVLHFEVSVFKTQLFQANVDSQVAEMWLRKLVENSLKQHNYVLLL